MADNFEDEVSGLALSEREITFCEQYAIYANGTKAATIAGYANSPGQTSKQLLNKADIQAYLKALRAKAAELAGVTLIRNAQEIAKIAYGNAASLRADWMNVKDWDELTDEEKSIISEVKAQVTTTYTKQGDPITNELLHFKTHNKLAALEMLNKMFGFNQPDQVELSGKDGGAIQVTGMVIKKE